MGLNKLFFYVMLALFISGCVATSKTVKPTSEPRRQGTLVEEKAIPEATRTEADEITVASVPEVRADIKEDIGIVEEIIIGPISYSQITNLIGEFLEFKTQELDSGESKIFGTSENGLITVEIISSEDNVSEASMKLVYPKDIETVYADLNNAMMLRFLKNIVPAFEGWSDRAKDIVDRFHSMPIGTKDKDEIVFGGKKIQISFDKNADSIIVALKDK